MYDFTYMWNLENRAERLIDTENKLVVAREERSGDRGEIGEGD